MDEQADLNLVTTYDSYCREYNPYRKNCSGCGYVQGKPSCGKCRFYSCVTEKGVEHCELPDFPRKYFLGPTIQAEENGASSTGLVN